MLKKVLTYFLKGNTVLSILTILIGTVVWSLVSVRNGLYYQGEVYYWGPQAHDGLWHVALIQSLARGTMENPVFSGEVIKNYHLGFDLILSAVNRLTGISAATLYFRVTPPIFALLIGLLGYKLALLLSNSVKSAILATFFIYFGGSLGWVVNLVRTGEWGGESMFWSMQSVSTLINPPFALSLMILFGVLGYLAGKKTLSKGQIFIVSISLALLFEVKAYAGVLMTASFFILGLYRIIFTKDRSYLIISLFSALLIFLLTILFRIESQKLFVFYPFWFLEMMMLFHDRLNWVKFFQAMTAYKATGLYLKWLIFSSIAFVIFLLGNLSLRIAGFVFFLRKDRNVGNGVTGLIAVAILMGIVIPLFLLQEGTAWNTIQFFYYSQMLLGICSGIVLYNLIIKAKNRVFRIVIITLIVGVTMPTAISTLSTYLSPNPSAYVSRYEADGLNFIRSQNDGLVLSLAPLDVKPPEGKTPVYLHESTAYVSAFSNKPVFYADEVNLIIMNYNFSGRKEYVSKLLTEPNTSEVGEELRKYNITYIYKLKQYGHGLDEEVLNIKNIFDNDVVIVYKVL